eukprot:CAMPEP_0201564336 /NCGR_PEP_ID=MMETSP0190_2-20130828/2558_1 /ASSEMBLY_ACC=CAM_ASM_000263 /TAXON_ID=37353 /ORGANISM="Rosalina sp." /LENGTH=141 /DNA_ID=CAMNT_0047980379 /DNA_START=6 /DNA_END=431 /DNA_ORIENTATION=+
MTSMQEMRKQILQLTGKYDKLVQDVKGLKTKIKKDESTINGLQQEVNHLKKQKGGGIPHIGGNVNAMSKVSSAPGPAQSQPQPAKSNNNTMDPLDMFFGGNNNTTSNGGNAQPQNNGNTQQQQSNGGGGGGGDNFAGWTSF